MRWNIGIQKKVDTSSCFHVWHFFTAWFWNSVHRVYGSPVSRMLKQDLSSLLIGCACVACARMLPSVYSCCESDSPCCSFVCESSLLLHHVHIQVISIPCCFLLFSWHWVCMWECRQKIISRGAALQVSAGWTCPFRLLLKCWFAEGTCLFLTHLSPSPANQNSISGRGGLVH